MKLPWRHAHALTGVENMMEAVVKVGSDEPAEFARLLQRNFPVLHDVLVNGNEPVDTFELGRQAHDLMEVLTSSTDQE
jgi:hypothetical protein